jgi:hypothetical protein
MAFSFFRICKRGLHAAKPRMDGLAALILNGGVQRTKPALGVPHCFSFFRICKRGLHAAKQKSHGVNPGFCSLSGGLDSNQRPLAPHANTLPDCATTRKWRQI